MRQLQINSRDVLVVDVPEDAHDKIIVDMGYLIYKVMDTTDFVTDKQLENDAIRFLMTGKSKFANAKPPEWKNTGIKLPEGNWQLLGRLSEIDEETAKGLAESLTKQVLGITHVIGYKCYNGEKVYKRRYTSNYPEGYALDYTFGSALESLHSWAKANNIGENQILLVKDK